MKKSCETTFGFSIWWITTIVKTWFHLLSADDLFAPNTHAHDKKPTGTLKFDWIVFCVCHRLKWNRKWATAIFKSEMKCFYSLSCIIHLDRLKRFMSLKSISSSFNYSSQFVTIHFSFELSLFCCLETRAQVKVIQSIKIATAATIF